MGRPSKPQSKKVRPKDRSAGMSPDERISEATPKPASAPASASAPYIPLADAPGVEADPAPAVEAPIQPGGPRRSPHTCITIGPDVLDLTIEEKMHMLAQARSRREDREAGERSGLTYSNGLLRRDNIGGRPR
jgi:hypothetical protein